MVFINDKKFACESCIKGHRSSSCKHTDRPLYEIKKKGRPISQCDTCRELRQSKKLHSKCVCNSTDGHDSIPKLEATSSTRQRWGRFVPITPSLPNGISDITPSPSTSLNPKQKVDLLLNPCNCKSVWKCKCRDERDRNESSPNSPIERQNNLTALARAAAMCCARQSPRIHDPQNTNILRITPDSGKSRLEIPKRHNSRPSSSSHKRLIPFNQHKQPIPGPSLPPIHFDPPPPLGSSHLSLEFPIPPISTMKSLAGSGCTCGLHCACPGCVEHRGEDAAAGRADCASSGCTTCVDWQGGIGLPVTSQDSAITNQSTSAIRQFLARAASLPAPPHHRKGLAIDPNNVLVYPMDLFSRDNVNNDTDPTTGGLDMKERGAAFGLIKVPKMECCGGRCSCPEGKCGCGKSCDGQCGEHSDEGEQNHHRLLTGSVGSDLREADTPSIALTSMDLVSSTSTSKTSTCCCTSQPKAGF